MGPEADNWGEVRKLTASDRAVGDRFGWSVGISGDTVVAGAFGDDSNRGAAYIYERNKGGADNWGEVKKLTASDGAAGDLFGISVSISGDTVVVGAYGDDTFIGAAYIYERNKNGMAPAAENWGEVKKLTASDGTAAEFFGYSVGISGDTVVVAAIGDDSNRGAAYIYERNKGVMGPEAENWGEVKKLTASDRASEDRFGFSVSISGDTVVVGASGDDSNRGAAYIYERNKNGMAPTAENWGEVKKLTASDGASEDRFGWSVGISGDTVVVGAEGDDSNRGSAYIYERNKNGMAPAAENWGEVKKLTASDGAAGDLFGYSVGISGDTVVVGAYFDDSLRGSAYIFTCEEIAPNTPPTIAPMNATRTAGTAVSVSKIAEVSDAEDAENTLSVTAMLQSGMGVTITGISVDVLGNVTASIAAGCTATTSTFELKVTDSGELMATAILTVTVNPNPLPVLSYTNKSLGVGKTALFYPSTGPSDNVGVTSLVLQSVTPSTGLSLSLNTSNGVITVLSASIAGTYIVEVVATDNCGAQRTATFNVTVTCPTTTLSTLANGQAGVAYNRTITVTPAGSYTFTVISGALPPGLVLDETTGAITGTPGATGTFNFTVRAAGTSGCSATRAYSLVISCPMVTVGPASLPAATQGVFYSQTVTVAPAGSYGFVLSFGSLPPGLALNAMTGEISGTPVLKGSYYVTVRASGFGACTGSRSYLLVVQ
ncbi:MAG: putative Ig domain-containing protein [Blastocatellales bacterium]|nr:putative Ig domain-containing protein [Blastocatellales bacterium]